MKRVLMVANGNTTFNGFSFLAQYLFEKRGDYCDILCENENIDVDRFLARNHVDSSNIGIIKMNEMNLLYPDTNNKIYRMIIKIKKVLGLYGIYLKKSRIVKRLFTENCYNEVLVRTDNRVGYEPYIIKEANKRKIPVIIVPMATVSSDSILLNEKNGYKVPKVRSRSILERTALYINPNWVKDQKDRLVYYFDPFRLIFTNILHLMSPMPWIVGCGYSNIACTATEKNYIEACQYLGNEKAWEKYIWTGTVEEQCVKESIDNREIIKKKIINKYDLKGSTVCIYSDSPLYEVGILDEFHKEMFTRFILDEISRRYEEVLISPHPLSNMSFLRRISSEYGFNIMDEPLRTVIGAADVNIFPDTSGEDEWAKKFGIPRITFPRKSAFEKMTDETRKKISECINGTINTDKVELKINIRQMSLLDVI